ncbi:hypothetical protein DPMN_066933 [Dreissena polymorpha]|uniref:Uncharacterized protein n=1 Tax=Dreissena polymorpha TaxID=45954 RepID=A0A9D4BSF8_DREPO|nr:hypothetical protein DPMN_066933 [Dreissena polymorpha]
MEMLTRYHVFQTQLSPCPSYVVGIIPADLPCGGCHYCARAHDQWAAFTDDVDDATGLVEQGSFQTRGDQTTSEHEPSVRIEGAVCSSTQSDCTEVENVQSVYDVSNRQETAGQLGSYPWDSGGETITLSCQVVATRTQQKPVTRTM